MSTRRFSLGWGKGLCFACGMVCCSTIMALLEAVELRRPICPARHYWQSSGRKNKKALPGLEVCHPLPCGATPAKLLRLQRVSSHLLLFLLRSLRLQHVCTHKDACMFKTNIEMTMLPPHDCNNKRHNETAQVPSLDLTHGDRSKRRNV